MPPKCSGPQKAEAAAAKTMSKLTTTVTSQETESKALLRQKIHRILDEKPDVVSHTVLFHLQFGTYEIQGSPKQNSEASDALAASLNTWALLSRGSLIEVISGVGLISDAVLTSLKHVKGTKHFVSVVIFDLHTKAISHLYSKSLKTLIERAK